MHYLSLTHEAVFMGRETTSNYLFYGALLSRVIAITTYSGYNSTCRQTVDGSVAESRKITPIINDPH